MSCTAQMMSTMSTDRVGAAPRSPQQSFSESTLKLRMPRAKCETLLHQFQLHCHEVLLASESALCLYYLLVGAVRLFLCRACLAHSRVTDRLVSVLVSETGGNPLVPDATHTGSVAP